MDKKKDLVVERDICKLQPPNGTEDAYLDKVCPEDSSGMK